MDQRLKQTPGIYLVGFMGSGKSSIGRRLADELGWPFADVDADIEADQGVSIAHIFDTRGEPEFRKLETAAIRRRVREIEKGKPMVMALGGGAFTIPENIELLEENGIAIWLDCPFFLVQARVAASGGRPLARDAAGFEKLYSDRRASYEKADFRIEITGDDPGPVVAAILQLPIF